MNKTTKIYIAGHRGLAGIGVELLMIDFYQVGLHENFYDELKRYLKSEG